MRCTNFLLIVFSAFSMTSCYRSSKEPNAFQLPPVEVSALTIHLKTVPVVFEYVGAVQSYHRIEVRSRVEGYLEKIGYIEGQLVHAGDLLFKIDPKPFEAAVDNAKGEVAVQEAGLWNAKRLLERLKPLYEQNAASRKDFDEALAMELAAKAQVDSAQARLKQAELNLNYTTIQSPITGLSGESTYSEGSLITPGASNYLTTIATIDPVYVSFHISESDVLKQRREIAHNQLELPKDLNFEVELILADETVYPYLGKVDFTEPTFRPSTGTMMSRALFPNPEGILRPGQFIRANVLGATRPHVVTIPQRAILQGNKGLFVYIVVDGKAVKRAVEPGEWYGDEWIINSGLKEGDVVIIDGVNKIEEGSPIIIQKVHSKGIIPSKISQPQ